MCVGQLRRLLKCVHLAGSSSWKISGLSEGQGGSLRLEVRGQGWTSKRFWRGGLKDESKLMDSPNEHGEMCGCRCASVHEVKRGRRGGGKEGKLRGG